MNNPELNIEWVDIELVHPNQWNPNVQSDFIYAKTRISILEHGFIDPIKVRQLENGQYEVIDGEHRWKIVNELITQIEQRGKRYYIAEKNGDDEKLYPIKKEIAQGKIPILNYGEVSDGVARELTLVLDYTRGEPDELKLAEVIKEIDAMLGPEEVERMLPYTGNELEDLMALLDGDDKAPDDFPEYDNDIDTEYKCPKCEYEWSGQPK